MIVIGIDPGSASGAVACIDSGLGIEWVQDLPLVDSWVDPHALAHLIGRPDLIVVERVSPMPKQGISSTAKMMRAFGAIVAVAQLKGRVELVTPHKWKSHHRLPADKEKARALAIRKFPAIAGALARKKDADRAEALLMADYGRTLL